MATKKTTTGLDAWANTRPTGSAPAQPAAPAPALPPVSDKPVSMPVRLTQDQYDRVMELARTTPGKRKRSASFQELALEGLNRLFAERGLPPL